MNEYLSLRKNKNNVTSAQTTVGPRPQYLSNVEQAVTWDFHDKKNLAWTENPGTWIEGDPYKLVGGKMFEN